MREGFQAEVFNTYNDFLIMNYLAGVMHVLIEFPTLAPFFNRFSMAKCANETEWISSTETLVTELKAGTGSFAKYIEAHSGFSRKLRFLLAAAFVQNPFILKELKVRLIDILLYDE
jgi:hypothetical protein